VSDQHAIDIPFQPGIGKVGDRAIHGANAQQGEYDHHEQHGPVDRTRQLTFD
jgi:hypothetical protein